MRAQISRMFFFVDKECSGTSGETSEDVGNSTRRSTLQVFLPNFHAFHFSRFREAIWKRIVIIANL